jgi:hypothetical protein
MNPWDSWTADDWTSHYIHSSHEQHVTGTLLGRWTVAELKDLLAEKNGLVADTESTLSKVQAQWMARNPAEAKDWLNDWAQFKARYDAAVSKANAVISLANVSLLPDAYSPADDVYKAVLRALSPTPNKVTKGSLADLIRRLSMSGIHGSNVQHTTIQPRLGTDADLNMYQRADAAVRTLDPFGLFNPNAPKGETKEKWKTIGLVAAGVAALILVLEPRK